MNQRVGLLVAVATGDDVDPSILLDNLRGQPESYFGRPSLSRLCGFLAGYLYGEQQFGEQSSEAARLDAILKQFDTWVEARYGRGTTHAAPSLIRFHSQDDRDAYDRFWALFDEFLETTQRPQ